MICPKCGKKIEEEGAIFCPNCGNKLNVEKRDTSNTNTVGYDNKGANAGAQERENKKINISFKGYKEAITAKNPLSKKKTVVLVAAGAVVLISAIAISNRKTTINMNDVYDIELSGYDGNGTLEVTFDADKFVQKYKNKLSLDKKSARKWVKKEYDDNESARDAYNTLCSYDNVAEHIGDLLEYNYDIEPKGNGELKNGDSVEFICEDEELIETLEELYHCKFKELKNYKVKGLEELEEYDPFADIKVTFSGTEPYGTIQVENPDDEVGKRLQYIVNDNGTFCNGDTATITVTSDEWTDIESDYGKTLSRTSYEVKVEGLEGYVNSADEISDDVLDKMKKEVEDVVTSKNALADENGSTILNAEYIGNYFIKAKNYDSYEDDYQNSLYLCYRVDVENYVENAHDLYDEVHTYYTYFCFDNIMSDGNGTVIVDDSSYRRPDSTYTVNGPLNDYNYTIEWEYEGYEDIETMYNKNVLAKTDRYTSEDNVKDVETSYEPTKLTAIPKSAKEYNGHYYDIVNVSLTWEEAKNRCERKGGHLATITSKEENEWIVKNINPSDYNYCWLGGERDINGNWGWITGEEWKFTSFAEGQPDYYDSSEYYLCTYTPANCWDDSDMEGNCYGNGYNPISGYIIEWEGTADQEEKSDNEA